MTTLSRARDLTIIVAAVSLLGMPIDAAAIVATLLVILAGRAERD